jgi:hypothetical protein
MVGLQRTQADLDREFDAQLAYAEQLQAHSHRPHVRVGKVTFAVAGMLRVEAVRNQERNRLAEQFLAGEAEELLGLRVDEHDLAALVDDDHGVWCRFEQGPEFVTIPLCVVGHRYSPSA